MIGKWNTMNHNISLQLLYTQKKIFCFEWYMYQALHVHCAEPIRQIYPPPPQHTPLRPVLYQSLVHFAKIHCLINPDN